MQVTFLGTGDAFGSGARFQTCIALTAGARRWLVDCGASSLVAMQRFSVQPSSVGAVLLTHLHGDHFGGLPFLFLEEQFASRRRAPLVVAGPEGTRERVTAAMEALFPGSSRIPYGFETSYVEWHDGEAVDVNGARVTPFAVVHDSGATPFALRVEREGKVVCYSGDTEWTPALAEACRGADLFVVEATAYDGRMKLHLDYATLLAHRAELAARRIIVTHMGPGMLAHAAGAELETARDGLVVEL